MDGILQTATRTSTEAFANSGVTIGSDASDNYYSGSMDDIRITKIARTDYTVPTATFEAVAPEPLYPSIITTGTTSLELGLMDMSQDVNQFLVQRTILHQLQQSTMMNGIM